MQPSYSVVSYGKTGPHGYCEQGVVLTRYPNDFCPMGHLYLSFLDKFWGRQPIFQIASTSGSGHLWRYSYPFGSPPNFPDYHRDDELRRLVFGIHKAAGPIEPLFDYLADKFGDAYHQMYENWYCAIPGRTVARRPT